MFLFICLFLVFGEYNWSELINGSTTTIYYSETTTSKTGWSYEHNRNYDNNFILNSNFESEELILSDLDYKECDEEAELSDIIIFDSKPPNLNTIHFKNWSDNGRNFLYTHNLSQYLKISVGCFGEETGCSSSPRYWSAVLTNASSFIIFGSDVSQNLGIRVEEIIENPFSYLFVYIDGIANQNIGVMMDLSSYEELLPYSKMYYLFTSPSRHNNITYYDHNIQPSTDFKIGNICSRKNVNRYVLFEENQKVYTNCSCWTRNNVTEMNQSTIFNYPDCNYNSTLFDLILPSKSTTYSLSDDLLKWYSIRFTTSSQSIQINDGKTLTIDELDINQDDILFNGIVYVKDLTISTFGASFNVLDFDNINYLTTNVNEVLFTIQSTSTSTDLIEFGLEQINNDIIVGLCIYNGIGYVDRSSNEMNECSIFKLSNDINTNLLIESSEYIITSNEYWNILEINEEELILDGSSTLTAIICEFENKTIKINCYLFCKTMNINSNTKLIVNYKLTITTTVINGVIDNLNQNGIIELYGSLRLRSTLVDITTTQPNCFELISSNGTVPSRISLTISGYSTLLLSQNHLLRICPSSNTNYGVQCTVIGNAFEQESFDLLHCPCIDSNCTINVNTTELDTRNIGFDGLFNILTNSTIAISYKTSSFTIEHEDDKQILIIGNGAVGFETSLNTNSLKVKQQHYQFIHQINYIVKHY